MPALRFELGCLCLSLAMTPASDGAPTVTTALWPSAYMNMLADAADQGHPCRLSQQSCNTQCQEQQTNCVLRCDQDPPCIRRCRATAEDCTARCLKGPAAPPADTPRPALGLLKPANEAVWATNQS